MPPRKPKPSGGGDNSNKKEGSAARTSGGREGGATMGGRNNSNNKNGSTAASRKSAGGPAPVPPRSAAASSTASRGRGRSTTAQKASWSGRGTAAAMTAAAPPSATKLEALRRSCRPPPSPIDVPFAGHCCCVYVDQGCDFFRPHVLESKLGGWHPSRVVRIQKLTDADAAQAAASPYCPYYQHEEYEYDAPVYDITVVSDFFPGRKRMYFPNPYVVLTEPADEPYPSFSLLHDDRYVVFQAQPRIMGPGDVVFARYQAGDKWYRGRVVDVYEEGALPPSMGGNNRCSIEHTRPGDNDGRVAVVAAAAVASSAAGPFRQFRPGHVASADPSLEAAPSSSSNTSTPTTTMKRRKKLLCSIAYDGGLGRATIERDVPYQDGSDDEDSDVVDDYDDNDDDDDDEGDSLYRNGYLVPKDLPYVYLAERGSDDVGWIQLELERMRECREKLPLTLDQQVPCDPPPQVASSSLPWNVLPVARALLLEDEEKGRRGDPDASSPEFVYFKYEDIVWRMYERAFQRHGNRLLDVDWPSPRRLQKKKKRNNSHKSATQNEDKKPTAHH